MKYYFRLRFALTNATDNYLRFKIRVVCGLWREFLTLYGYQLNLSYQNI